jgi:xanthine dehydrogenase YagS FAD-binding subunit
MYPFEYLRAEDVASAAALGAEEISLEYIAGGTDMLQLLKDDVRRPRRLLDISRIHGLSDIEISISRARIGALARMSDVADHPYIQSDYPAVAQALLASASAQLRNMATIGGNLLQRTRCMYYRDAATACNKRAPGSGCSAIAGENRMLAVVGGSEHCVASHPSDLAVALVALDATVIVQGVDRERRIPVEEFHRLPGRTPERETALEPGELIVAVEIPASEFARRSLYRKVRDRASFEFALVSVAASYVLDEGLILDARVALGGVGTKPWREVSVEEALVGSPPEPAEFIRAASRALREAQPLSQNAFKVPLVRNAIVQALTAVER